MKTWIERNRVDWGNVKPWSETGSRKAHPEAMAPDAWIEEYAGRFAPPEDSQQDRGKSAVRTELDAYDGSALHWFELIDMFRCLVNESGRPAGEKLAI